MSTDVFSDVTLNVRPHQAGWKMCLASMGFKPATFGLLVHPAPEYMQSNHSNTICPLADVLKPVVSQLLLKTIVTNSG